MKINSIYSIKKILKQRWLVVSAALLLTSLGAAITGTLFKSGIKVLETWKIELLYEYSDWIVLPVLGGVGGTISALMISKLAPAAGGSGVIQIMGYLQHKSVPMNLKVGLVKLCAGIIAIGSGFPLGPEGPSVQMGGSVAWQLGKWLRAPRAFRRVLVAAGGGAGIAAIFSAPIGGFVYAIEELLNSARPVILLLVVVTTFCADSWADILQAIGLDPSGGGGFDSTLGFQLERAYTPLLHFLPVDFIYLIALGILAGMLAELYSRFILFMQRKSNKFLTNNLMVKMGISGSILGLLYAYLPDYLYKTSELQKLLALGKADLGMALTAFIIVFITTGIAAGSGAPGGLFYPMLTLGAAMGLICGILVQALTGHVPSTFIFAGMGAFIAGCSRTPITAMFLAFALTKDLLILKPILVASLTSFLIARVFNEESIYERQLKIKFKNIGIGEKIDQY